MNSLPTLDATRQAHADRVSHHMRQFMTQQGGYIPFSTWMEQVLYAPSLGYYTVATAKIGDPSQRSDFITAPEMTPLFGQMVARHVFDVFKQIEQPYRVIEFGAGTGALAHAVLTAAAQQGVVLEYQILDLSDDLRQRQQARLAEFSNVSWIDHLPTHFSGCILANEVMDAMPVSLIRVGDDLQFYELGVGLDQHHEFVMQQRKVPAEWQAILHERIPDMIPGYTTEINWQAEAWVRSLGACLETGAALLIDYGFPRNEYYHPQRAEGTLMCHFQHQAHPDPLILPGLQDITAHVDFTAMADAALESGMQVYGYVSQANFLINTGLLDYLAQHPSTDHQVLGACQKLLSEAEMGELFKVMCVGKGLSEPILGFQHGDRRHRL